MTTSGREIAPWREKQEKDHPAIIIVQPDGYKLMKATQCEHDSLNSNYTCAEGCEPHPPPHLYHLRRIILPHLPASLSVRTSLHTFLSLCPFSVCLSAGCPAPQTQIHKENHIITYRNSLILLFVCSFWNNQFQGNSKTINAA